MTNLASSKKRALVLASIALLGAFIGCGDSFPRVGPSKRLTVRFAPGMNVGSVAQRLPLSLDAPSTFTLTLEALKRDGSRDLEMNGFVRFVAKPGAVVSVVHPRAAGRNVRMETGLAENVTVSIVGSYGDTTIWAEDAGYEPADPLANPPPQCSDGIDNDGDGTVDYPADPGCEAPNDNTEAGGSYTSGASDVIFFSFPRIADVRGVANGGGATAFPKQQVEMSTGYDPATNAFAFDTVVTRISSDGFYATDTGDPRGYSSVFAFNFNPPPRMRVCDRLRTFGGTASDFFGFTEIGYPTWTLDEWQGPQQRPCLVPEPTVLGPIDVDPTALRKVIAGLVRVATQDGLEVHVGKHFGEKKLADAQCITDAGGDQAKLAACVKDPADDASNCDINGDGKVDFNKEPEKTCANKCTADLECTEYSNYDSRSAFRFVLNAIEPNPPIGCAAPQDCKFGLACLQPSGNPCGGTAGCTCRVPGCSAPSSSSPECPGNVACDGAKCTLARTIQGNGTAAADFDPLAFKGKSLRGFTGTLRFFSGGAQYTIEARCSDDIVTDLAKAPLPSDKACVFPRTQVDNNAGTN